MTKNFNLTVFGDSIPEGIITQNGKLEKLTDNVVNIVANHFNFKINNLSVYGQTLSRLVQKKAITEYLNKIDEKQKNIVVISLGGNDSDYDWKEVEKSPELEHLPKTPPEQFEKLLIDTTNELKKAKVKVFLTTIPPLDSKRYFENVICKLADGKKILQFFKNDINTIYRHQESYNCIINKVAKMENIKLIDTRYILLQDKNFLDKICLDGIHPNADGHKIMANEIIRQMENEKWKI